MDVITTHINADFDCLGSMIAAKRLYPDAIMVFPGGQERSLREFFIKSVQYVFGFKRVRDIDLDAVTRLILVDVRQASRIGPFSVVAKKPDVDIHIYDHHESESGSLKGSTEHVEPVGSTVTVFAHLFMAQGVELTEDEATMMMLGLYEDTGSLTFHTTTVKDYQAAAFLLSHGANLNIVADLIVQELTPDQVRLLKGDETPIRIEIEMSNSAGVFQVDELLKRKLRNSSIAPYVVVVAQIEGETEKRLLEFYTM